MVHFCNNPINFYRSAYEFKLHEQHIFVMADINKQTRIVVNSSLIIVNYPTQSDALTDEFGLGLRKSNLASPLLENLSQACSTATVKNTLGQDWKE